MACAHKLIAVRREGGRMKILGSEQKIDLIKIPEAEDKVYLLPCGQCRECRYERARQWAVRCMHESDLYVENCFVTLTYSPRFLPSSGSLVKKDFQNFMKKLRKKMVSYYYKKRIKGTKKFSEHYKENQYPVGHKIRYLMCGEYGDKLGRPHYHVLLFNCDFYDKQWHSGTGENKLYTSKILEEIWDKGFCTIGAVTFGSASYVARYVVKKVNGKIADEHYQGRIPEYATMSRRPGIGKNWFLKYGDGVYPQDFLIINDGVKCKPPRYYDKQLELTKPEIFDSIKELRERLADESESNKMYHLRAKEKMNESRTKHLKRSYEDGTENYVS